MSVDANMFRQTLGRFASGVTIVTMSCDGHISGLTVSAFCSLSLEPPRILVCIDKNSLNTAYIRKSGIFAVNILHEEQSNLSSHFARKTKDKFCGVAYHLGNLGLPLLDEALCTLECKLVQEVDGGDHFIYIGVIEHANFDASKRPLLYYRGNYGKFS